ncbi:MAG: hydrogenase maturation nickel metallochaperone HypA [Actinobacteria bacterium]|nr:hydrogenase maturation nickel metallochaperone HypA [Actinomycetota bacterium]
MREGPVLVHEVSLCRQLAAAVTRATGGRPVETVYLRVGELRQVVPEALEYAWTFVVRGTPLSGSALALDHVPAVLRCDDCAVRTRLGPGLGFSCPACGSARTHLMSGEEFVLTAVDVHDEMPPAPAGPVGDDAQRGLPDGALSPS